MGVIAVIIIFLLLVTWHEYGHLIMAKLSKVRVKEFGIGIPPKIKSLGRDKSGTLYSLNLIPLGWFVRLKGENPYTKEFLEEDSFITASFFNKVMILLGGILANIIIAYLIFVTVFLIGTKPLIIIPENAIQESTKSYIMPDTQFAIEKDILDVEIVSWPAKVTNVVSESRAEDIWLSSWSVITHINWNQVNNQTLKVELQKNINQTIQIQRVDDGVIKQWFSQCKNDCVLWVMIHDKSQYTVKETKTNLANSFVLAGQELRHQTRMTFWMLWQLFQDAFSEDQKERQQALDSVSWPVWAAKIGSQIWETGGSKMLLIFAAMISLALAIFNILPIPALDWGRLLSVIIQKISWMHPTKYFKIESSVNLIFFIMLMALWIFIIIKDLQTFRWIHIF